MDLFMDLLNLFRVVTLLREAPEFESLNTWRMSPDLLGGLGTRFSASASSPAMGDPASTASTAAWHWAQLPDDIKPTDPNVGFTIRPQASYKSDLKIADQKTHITLVVEMILFDTRVV